MKTSKAAVIGGTAVAGAAVLRAGVIPAIEGDTDLASVADRAGAYQLICVSQIFCCRGLFATGQKRNAAQRYVTSN